MLKVLPRLYNLLLDYFHPSLEAGARKVGILEDMHCSSEEIERLEKMIKDYEKKRCENDTSKTQNRWS